MKIEVINPSTLEVVETYSIPYLSIFDFQQWKDESEIIIHLNCLLNKVKNLDSKDSETNEPISNPREVDFYLPDPIKKRVFSQLTKLLTSSEESNTRLLDRHNETIERVSTPELKSSTILLAVTTEILQNHHQRSDYKVRISNE